MAENKIIPWAQTGTANVLSDDAYASDVAKGGLYGDGVKTGQASSQQANKTWRQATAPGSGLSQFLVDNLSVDVTDSDTPDTFSTRIANAVLKLAQVSPFNQSWATSTGGYRKYAIVSDSSGNFWVSTADQNTNVPGDDSAKWQSLFDGYATQTWANGRFQPAGDYATNPALQAETQRATTIESNLQSSKANLAGGNHFSGEQDIFGPLNVVAGGGGTEIIGLSPPPLQGSRWIWNYNSGDGATHFRTYRGSGAGGFVFWNGTTDRDQSKIMTVTKDGNIVTPLGTVALTSQIPNAVTQSQYSNDFLTSDSRVINLAWGHKIQSFTVYIPPNGSNSHRITYPQAFSGPSTAAFNCNDTGQSRSVSLANGTQPDSTGFNISVSVHGNSTGASTDGLTLTVLAIGPK